MSQSSSQPSGEDSPGDDFARGSVKPAEGHARRECAGDTIHRYELVREIGEGGMGTVWLARQFEPVQRDVALKIIKLGMDTREVIVRFEAERQALALMDHPHIAKVLDGGATVGGRPYFVMEYVQGRPITTYCDDVKLGVRERLKLLVKVCAGIQHAHLKGIIHRDIKPGNVLVALQDGLPVPKVIDFGIAKATSVELTQGAIATQVGQMLGTPDSMPPEQLGLGGFDVDTRADVYSLGVLLYELLTGTRPFDLHAVIQAGYEELLRTIREVDPDKPSTRISKAGESVTSIAAHRRADAKTLVKGIDGDLDWIVMKALEKDRSRRYETASGLADDVERFLNDEPVLAAPPSAAYRVRKLVRRRKKTVVAALIIVFLFLVGSMGTGIGYWKTVQANKSLDRALGEKDTALREEARQRDLAQDNERRARAAEREARREAERARLADAESAIRSAELAQVVQFQAEQLGAIDPALMGVRLRRALLDAAPEDRREALAANLLGINFTNLALGSLEANVFGRTLEAIEMQFPQQPFVRARLLQTVATTLSELGLFEAAKVPQEEALSIRRIKLGADHPDTLDSDNRMKLLRLELGQWGMAEAESIFREAIERHRRVLGDDHRQTLDSIETLAVLLRAQGKPLEAEVFVRQTLEERRRTLGDDHRETLRSLNNLAIMLLDQKKLSEAEEIMRESLASSRRVLGAEHQDTMLLINNLAVLMSERGGRVEAESLLQEAVAASRKALGDDHPHTLNAIHNLGYELKEQGRLSEAEPLLREALEGRRRVLGSGHLTTLSGLYVMADLFQRQGTLFEVEPLLRESVEGHRRILGDKHPKTLTSLQSVASFLHERGELGEAESLFRESLEGRLLAQGEDHPDTLVALNNLAGLLQDQGKLLEAVALFRKASAGCRRVLGDEHPHTRTALDNLALLLDELVQSARATGDSAALGAALAYLGDLHLDLGEHYQAESAFREAAEALLEAPLQGDQLMWQVQSGLGVAIAAQGHHGEAEELLTAAAEWALTSAAPEALESSAGTLPVASAATALQRVVDLYDAWHLLEPGAGHDGRAREWGAKRDGWIAGTEAGSPK